MATSTFQIIMLLAVIIVPFAGIIVLQIFLSKRENKWLGLILPLLFVVFSLIMALSFPMYSVYTGSVQIISEDGGVIRQERVENAQVKLPIGQVVTTMVIILFMGNIPTIILLAIYAACREKTKRRLAMEKMRIQDLE